MCSKRTRTGKTVRAIPKNSEKSKHANAVPYKRQQKYKVDFEE